MMRFDRANRGFTLIELMITIAVLVILVGIGYPLYSEQVQKARRVDARSGLMRLTMAEERYYALNGSYATQAQLANEYTKIINELDYDNVGGADFYTFAITLNPDGVATTPDYNITATRAGTQSGASGDTDCDVFTITETGAKSATDSGGTDSSGKCW